MWKKLRGRFPLSKNPIFPLKSLFEEKLANEPPINKKAT
tara:strand:+ start:178 stop:294 length:117 start_codon:yes stop_codon:yes gene_type:complete